MALSFYFDCCLCKISLALLFMEGKIMQEDVPYIFFLCFSGSLCYALLSPFLCVYIFFLTS